MGLDEGDLGSCVEERKKGRSPQQPNTYTYSTISVTPNLVRTKDECPVSPNVIPDAKGIKKSVLYFSTFPHVALQAHVAWLGSLHSGIIACMTLYV